MEDFDEKMRKHIGAASNNLFWYAAITAVLVYMMTGAWGAAEGWRFALLLLLTVPLLLLSVFCLAASIYQIVCRKKLVH